MQSTIRYLIRIFTIEKILFYELNFYMLGSSGPLQAYTIHIKMSKIVTTLSQETIKNLKPSPSLLIR